MSITHVCKIFLLLSALLCGLLQTLSAQVKYEREIRIESDAAHPKALHFVNSLNLNRKVKWYREIGLDTTSIEAKTKFNGKWHSIEFSEDGTLEDIEIEIKWREIDNQIAQQISGILDSIFDSFKINKVQLQYIGKPEFMTQLFDNHQNTEALTLNYELIVSSKVDGEFKSYEFLFSSEPELLSKRKIVSKNNMHIEY